MIRALMAKIQSFLGSEDPIMSRPLHHYWTMALNLLLTTLDNNSLNRRPRRQKWVLPIIISQFGCCNSLFEFGALSPFVVVSWPRGRPTKESQRVCAIATPSQWPGWLEGRRKISRFSGRAWGQLAHNESQQWRGPSACQYKVYQGKVGHVGDDWWPPGHLPLTRVQHGLQVMAVLNARCWYLI